jgi:hypothetical protein
MLIIGHPDDRQVDYWSWLQTRHIQDWHKHDPCRLIYYFALIIGRSVKEKLP